MVFAPGPIFANIVLADEINRTPPKTQSALLEAMQEHRVTIQGRTYQLAEPFYVFATQNPIELEGTYPLPEAQLDRFMFHIIIEHPPYGEEIRRGADDDRDLSRPSSQAGHRRRPDRLPAAGAQGAGGRAGDAARARHRARLPAEGSATPTDFVKKWVAFGASVRAAQYLVLGGKARALTSGRYHVSFEDIRALAHPVLRHRIITNFHAQSEGGDHRRHRRSPAAKRCRCRAPGCERARKPTPSPARASWTRWSWRASGTWSSCRRPSSTASSTACTRRRTSARRWTSPSTAATCPATTSAAWTGACGRAPTGYYIKEYEAESNMNFSCCWTCRSRWTTAAAASPSSTTRASSPRA